MKKRLFAVAAALLFAAGSAFAKKAPEPIPSVQETFELNKYNRQLGYQIVDGGRKIVFVYDANLNKIESPKAVYVTGSFNGWTKSKSGSWECEQIKKSVWTMECDADEVRVPGNSGFPEFKFHVYATEKYTETVCGKVLERERNIDVETNPVSKIPGFKMMNNNLILFPEDDPNVVVENTKTAEKVIKRKELNLEDDADRFKVSNIRIVPGTTKLYRGYHPYIKSRGQFDTENVRMKIIPEILEQVGIQSIITLSGDDARKDGKKVPAYVNGVSMMGNQGVFDTNYNTVYYKSNGKDFGNLIQDIVHFINIHPAPYYIHCRLGTDRTGTVSAVLAALCGASWDEIAADYQKSNETGIKEFRDQRLLKYSFEKMLEKPLDEVTDLQKDISDYFVKKGYLTEEEIKTLQQKLK